VILFPKRTPIINFACGLTVATTVVTLAAAPRPNYPVTSVAPSILSTGLDERSVSFTGDGRTAYFPVRIGDGYLQVLCTAVLRDGHWSEPSVLPFSGGPAFDADPFITADGRTLYFASSRSVDGKPKNDLDIWVAIRDGDHWSAPHPVAGKVNGPGNERSPVLAASGRLYFSATKDGRSQLFYAEPTSDGFGEPVSLGENINNDGDNVTLAINSTEDVLVFASLGRADDTLAPGQGYPRGDLYLSRKVNSEWSPVRHLPAPINSTATELSPAFSKDGKWLYFMSERSFASDQKVVLTYEVLSKGLATSFNGRGNIYRIDARALKVQP
jgi:Tol biopolymer transport system component